MKARMLTLVLAVGIAGGVFLLGSALGSIRLWSVQQGYEPPQPIAFSHRLHAGEMQISCRYVVTGPWREQRAENERAAKDNRPPRRIVSPELEKRYTALALNERLEVDPARTPQPLAWTRCVPASGFRPFQPQRAHHRREELPVLSRSSRNDGDGASGTRPDDGPVCGLPPKHEGQRRRWTAPEALGGLRQLPLLSAEGCGWEKTATTGDAWSNETSRRSAPTSSLSRCRPRRCSSAGAAALAGCSRPPVEKAIPLPVQPEEFVPGRSYFYSTTCGACSAGCGVVAKVRDGRPIRLEGNPAHPLSRGGLGAVGQAALYDLYDSTRLRVPRLHGKETSGNELDQFVKEQLGMIRELGGAVRRLTGTLTSPTMRALCEEFLAQFRHARLIQYDSLSAAAILDAHQQTHGLRVLPRYRFDRAEGIPSFDADFLGTWNSPVEYTAGWRSLRQPDADPPGLSYHVQFEARLSLTGSKADRRIVLTVAAMEAAVSQLAAHIAARTNAAFPEPPGEDSHPGAILEELADRL